MQDTAAAGARAELAHLYRRAGFGARPDELDAAVTAGYEATVGQLLHPSGPDAGATATPPPGLGAAAGRPPKGAGKEQKRAYAKARRTQANTLVTWWLDRMVRADEPFGEKLTLLWHDHWATSIQKVKSAGLMLRQNQTLRAHGTGDFRMLARAMVQDPALLLWLDGPKNKRTLPNENLSRELMELFVLGIGHYTEDDVREAARALTGWRVDRVTGAAALRPAGHDDKPKTVLGRTADFDDQSLVDLLVAQPASAAFVATRLWHRLVSPADPSPDVLARLLSAYGPGQDVRALVRAMLLDASFRSPAVRHALVKQPIEYVVGTLRALRLGAAPEAIDALHGMGQVPFAPPNVGGWPAGSAWLTASTAQARLRFAEWAAGRADLAAVTAAVPAARIDGVARLLSVDSWTPRTRTALAAASTDPQRLVTLALVAPEYVVS
ncbi:MAG: DUF1800 domain-containing protein [Pseudonocardiales bacterium]|nr:MAG: DUF1800 domain-containing protein [Pseudonocardiales bacterium]